MARMPGAEWVGEQSPRVLMSRYDGCCVHTIVGWAPAHAAHFSTKFNGTILQSRDTRYRSGANLYGNHRIIAIENEDGGKAVPLTDEQVEANAKILAFCHTEHGVPLDYMVDSLATSRGLCVHRQGIDGNFVLPANTLGLPRSMWMGRVEGGELWTTSPGKECPRNNKIEQVPLILTRAKQIVNGDTDMPLSDTDLNKVDRLVRTAINERCGPVVWNHQVGPTDNKRRTAALIQDAASDIDINALADAVAAKVLAGLPDDPQGGATPAEVYNRCRRAVVDVFALTQPAEPTT